MEMQIEGGLKKDTCMHTAQGSREHFWHLDIAMPKTCSKAPEHWLFTT